MCWRPIARRVETRAEPQLVHFTGHVALWRFIARTHLFNDGDFTVAVLQMGT